MVLVVSVFCRICDHLANGWQQLAEILGFPCRLVGGGGFLTFTLSLETVPHPACYGIVQRTPPNGSFVQPLVCGQWVDSRETFPVTSGGWAEHEMALHGSASSGAIV